MAIQTKQTEEFLLKIVKIIVLAGMALALLMVLILGANVAYQSTKTPKEPAPAQKAPEKEVSMEELKKFLLNGDKADEAQSPASSPKSIAPPCATLKRSPVCIGVLSSSAKRWGLRLNKKTTLLLRNALRSCVPR